MSRQARAFRWETRRTQPIWGPLITGLGLILVAIGLGIAAAHYLEARSQAQIRQQFGEAGLETFSQKGQPAPDFSLLSLDGKTYRLSDLKGRPVVLNFWATWCPPCEAEMPLLDARAVELQGQVVFLAVNAAEPEDMVKQFVEARDFHALIILLDPKSVAVHHYRVNALPTTFFIDAQGTIRAIHLGVLTEDLLTQYLQVINVSGGG